VNFDSSPTVRFARIPVVGFLYARVRAPFPPTVRHGDVVAGLPVGTGACRGVYASHVLEHLCLDDCRVALRETLRILAVDGTFRLVVPDLQVYAERYLSAIGAGDDRGAVRFLEDTGLGVRSRVRSPVAMASRMLGNSAHQWMWDETSLRAELDRAGFRAIRRAKLGDGQDPMFAAVEDPERFIDACAMEARR